MHRDRVNPMPTPGLPPPTHRQGTGIDLEVFDSHTRDRASFPFSLQDSGEDREDRGSSADNNKH
eukprot:m.433988 g.433988  ORF g.433988 m.433988 type:complete len:64 (-) comp95780_c0_seq1:18-209(-)